MAFLHTSVKLRFPSLRSRHYTTYSSEQGPGQHKQAADLSISKPTCFLCHPLVTHGKVGGKQHRAQHRHRPAKAGPTKRHLRTRSNIDPQRQGRRSRPRYRPAKAGPTTRAAWSMSPSPRITAGSAPMQTPTAGNPTHNAYRPQWSEPSEAKWHAQTDAKAPRQLPSQRTRRGDVHTRRQPTEWFQP